MRNSILDKRVKPGMVYTGGSGGSGTYVVTRVTDKAVSSMHIKENDVEKGSAHWSGHGWFRPGEFEFIRQMGKRETKRLVDSIYS